MNQVLSLDSSSLTIILPLINISDGNHIQTPIVSIFAFVARVSFRLDVFPLFFPSSLSSPEPNYVDLVFFLVNNDFEILLEDSSIR